MTPRMTSVFVIAACCAGTASAASLDISWTPDQSAERPFYRLHIGTEPGRYTQVLTADEARIHLDGLADEQVYYLRVEQLERVPGRKGGAGEALRLSREVALMPAPRIDAVGSLLPAGEAGLYRFTVSGANFAPEVRVRMASLSFQVIEAVRTATGQLSVLVRHTPAFGEVGLPVVAAGQVLVINPGPKSPDYFTARPAAADVDGNGRVDAADIDALRAAFGAQGAAAAGADLTGDGAVDGDDLGVLGARLGRS